MREGKRDPVSDDPLWLSQSKGAFLPLSQECRAEKRQSGEKLKVREEEYI